MHTIVRASNVASPRSVILLLSSNSSSSQWAFGVLYFSGKLWLALSSRLWLITVRYEYWCIHSAGMGARQVISFDM